MSTPLSFDVGSEVQFLGRAAVITSQSTFDEVMVQFVDTGEIKSANVGQLIRKEAPKIDKPRVLDAIPEDDLETARERFEAIKPLLDVTHGKGEAFKARAEEIDVNEKTLRRWCSDYQARGLLSDLAPNRRGKRKRRLPRKVEAIIQDVIESVYLTKQKVTAKKAIDEVVLRCKAARLKPPHPNTIRARIKAIKESERVRRRQGAKAARDQFAEVKGEFPDGNFPLETVQIDHTKLDIILVDDDTRLPIGRPWLTVAIDVFSRMITGYYISLDAPSSFSVGMCIRHSALPKDAELEKLGIDGKWPVWGLMRTLHADNGKDFRSNLIQKACDEYGVNIAWRPVRQPHFGGHVERLMGTIAKEIHALPGTTFSNIQDKGEYNSAKQASMTLDELHAWFVTYVVGVYHQRVHKGVGMSPMEKWREGVLGTGRRKGTGLNAPVGNPERFAIDFLPFETRTVQREGIAWDGVNYLAPSIRGWIREKQGGQSVKFTIRRDPRDISRIYFLDPELKEYLEVPYRDQTRPSISLWELRAAKKYLRDRNAEIIDEDAIFDAIEEMGRIAESATTETKKARRAKQRKKVHARGTTDQRQSISLVVDNSKTTDEDEGEFDIGDADLEGRWEDWS